MNLRPRPTAILLAVAVALLLSPWQAGANLAAYFKFDGTVSDQTGQHPGTLFGPTNYVSGVVGQALNFSLGASGPTYVELANPDTIDFGKDFSVSLWLKTTSTGQRVFLSKNITNAWAYPGKQFMTSGQQVTADCNGSGTFVGNFTGSGVSVTDGQWHHVVLTYCGTISPYWNWYVDGYQQNSYGLDFTIGPDATGQHLRLGMRENGYGVYFLGQMDEVEIYDQTLTSVQAQYLFQHPGSTITNAPLQFVNSGTVFPRASTQAATTISTLNVDGLSTPDLFMMLSFQGCINRTQPRVFLVGHGIVEMQGALSSQFWLDQMAGYAKTNYTDPYALIKAFTNGLNGCVLYDATMFSSTSDNNLARINLAIMLCAKYGAVALTPAQVVTLSNAQITLPVLADARTLGSTWKTIYNYALTNLAPTMRTDILHHLGGRNGTNFCLLNVDYLVAQQIFTWNVPVTTTGTTAIQSNILALTTANTPVIGVWGLDYGSGEHVFVALLSGVGKFLTVTYETENLSFTTGLPMANIPDQTNRSLVMDPNKVYVAFIKTDGDNYSFVDRSWPVDLGVTNRIKYPLAWSLVPTVNELNPLAAAWLYRNVGSAFVTACDGVGYTWNAFSTTQNPHEPYLAPFLQLTDAYMATMKQSFVRNIWWTDYHQSLPYGALAHANGVHIGYTGTGTAVSNVQSAAFISRGKAFFQGYDFTSDMTNISQYVGPTPAFFSVGHHEGVASLVAAADKLSSRFMVVSPDELASLFRQFKANDVLASQSIVGAEFSPLDAAELLYLYNLEGATTNGTSGGSRDASFTNYWVYQFNMDSRVTSASVDLTLYNNYLVAASTNGANWELVAQASADVQDGSNLGTITRNLTRFLGGAGNNIYLKFSDASPGTGRGAALTHLKLTSLQTLPAQYVSGQWPVNEGSGSTLHNTSTNNSNWGMTLSGDPNFWGYWQPGAYAFAGGNNNAATALTPALGWTSGNNLTIKADFNVTGNLHNPGSVFAGGAIFGGGYFIPGGNAQGYNRGAFYAIVSSANPAAPTIEFDISGVAPGLWSHALPITVTNASLNGGWNTAEWFIQSNVASNSMSLQFRLNGTNVGGPITIAGGYLRDFPEYGGYTGTKFYIGAAADQSYQSFSGSIRNVSLTDAARTSTSLITSSLNPSSYGNAVTFTNTVTTVSGIPTGIVTFKEGTTTLGTGTLGIGSGNQASAILTLTNLTATTHTLIATYAGDTGYDGSASSTVSQLVNPKALTAGLTGTVSKTYDGGPTATLASGNYTLPGVVSGDTVNLNNPTSGTYNTKHQGTGKTVTVTGLSLSGSSATNYTLVNALAAGAIGTITKTNLTVTAAANAKVYNGTASAAATPTITAGSIQTGDSAPTWTESYDTKDVGTGKTLTPAGVVGDGNSGLNYNYTYAATQNGTISNATTAGSFISSPNPSLPGSHVTFTAAVTNSVPGGPAPAGNVQFKTNGVPLGAPVALNGSGVAAFSTNSLPHKANTVTAEYAGDGNFLGLTNSVVQVVNTPPVASAIPLGAVSGQPTTLRIIGGQFAPTDADSDPLTVTAVGSAANGTVTTDGTNVTYTSANTFVGTNTFTYTVSDTWDGAATNTVTVRVTTYVEGFNRLTAGSSGIKYVGIPGDNYALEYATNLTLPMLWTSVVTNVASYDGSLTFTNTAGGFYRTRSVP